ncbi:MAG: hypothetical protein K0Q49_2480 [Haloplasmataceae bacterium]|nr:hypothetical protein [Haloplasmataceae bacterium]
MEVKFTNFPDGSNWVKGTADNDQYAFESKLFDEGSDFGINGGRVSKLTIWKGEKFTWDNVVVNYDRGWDIEPEDDYKKLFDAVINFLENSPKRFQ